MRGRRPAAAPYVPRRPKALRPLGNCRHRLALAGSLGIVAGIAISATSCDSAGGPLPIAVVEIAPASWTFTAIGDTVQFTAVAKATDGTVVTGPSFTWGRRTGGVVDVGPAGQVVAVGPGSTSVTASTGGVTGEAAVSVAQTVDHVAFLDNSPTRITAIGDSAELLVAAFDARSQRIFGRTFSYRSLAEDVASVNPETSQSGWVAITALAPGIAGIVATVADKADTMTVEVRQAVARIELTPDSAVLEKGTTRQFAAVMFDRNGYQVTDRPPSWSSPDTLVATVTDSGLATAVGGKLGTGAIVASDGAASAAASIYTFTIFTAISAGDAQTCALAVDGQPYCWGFVSPSSGTKSAVPLAPVGAPILATIDAGVGVACGLTADGIAYCWGDSPFPPTPSTASDAIAFSSLSVGYREVCGLAGAGDAYCWGQNFTSLTDSPTLVPGSITFATVNANASCVCGTDGIGLAYCWGFGGSGSLGNGTYDDRSVPTPVVGGHTYRQVEPGGLHTCGIAADGAAWCWGGNSYGQFGDGSTISSLVPTPAASGLALSTVTPGAFHTCGMDAAGTAYCWGYAERGQLGHGIQEQVHLVPAAVSGGLTFVSLSAGGQHTCGLTAAGVVYCWGSNENWEVGDGTQVNRFEPTRVLGSRP